MNLGIFVETSASSRGEAGLDAFVAEVRRVADRGFEMVWAPQIFGLDALTAIAVAAREVAEVGFGTAAVPTYPRHPTMLAQQAITAQQAAAGRLTLGIGLSHKMVIESMWGLSFDKPARHMEEYLAVLMPLLAEGKVAFTGETFQVRHEVRTGATPTVPVVVAALGPRMLALAGSLTDGTVTWMTGPKTIGDHIAPSLAKAAADAGRPAPRVVVALPTSVTDDVGAARALAGQLFANYGFLPSYRAMLDREGAAGPADVAIVGDEAAVRGQIEAVIQAGATEFVAVPFDNMDRTLDLLATLRG